MAVLTMDFALDRGFDVALIDEIRSVTWAELDLRVNRLVNGLRDLGLATGDTVAVVAGNQCEWFEIAQACAHGGWTYVPVNWHWVADELAYVFNDAQAKVVLVDSRFEGPVAEALKDDRSQSVQHVVGIQCKALAAVRNNAHFVDFETLIAGASDAEPLDQMLGGPMFYTSGTTGRPKGVRGALSNGMGLTSDFMKLIASGF